MVTTASRPLQIAVLLMCLAGFHSLHAMSTCGGNDDDKFGPVTAYTDVTVTNINDQTIDVGALNPFGSVSGELPCIPALSGVNSVPSSAAGEYYIQKTLYDAGEFPVDPIAQGNPAVTWEELARHDTDNGQDESTESHGGHWNVSNSLVEWRCL